MKTLKHGGGTEKIARPCLLKKHQPAARPFPQCARSCEKAPCFNRKRVGTLAAMTQNCCATCVRIRTYDPQAYDMSHLHEPNFQIRSFVKKIAKIFGAPETIR